MSGFTAAGHYDSDDLPARLEVALRAASLADGRLTPEDLAPLDQFHTRGLQATADLAAAASVGPSDVVLDIGSGLGGPSRFLAARRGCRVHGIDLSPSFVAAASYLAARAGLSDMVSYERGDALALSTADSSVDVAWTQHVAMNIADRAGLYAQAFRVLRPGGRFAIYDIVAGSGEAVHFPVPWSRAPATSFLLSQQEMRRVLEAQGFRISVWTDLTASGVAWFAQQQAAREKAATTPGALGLHLAMGPDFPLMAANLGRNLRESRVGLVQAVAVRPA